METPQTLLEAIKYFADEDRALAFMVVYRWPDGVVKCPTCGSGKVSFLATRRTWKCKTAHPKQQFSVKVGTIFEDSPIPLNKWLCAMWLIGNCKNGVSSYEIARDLKVTQKSAWFMLHRLRVAMKEEHKHTFGGHWHNPIEVDETYIGGKGDRSWDRFARCRN